VAVPTCMFMFFAPGEVIVKKWNKEAETLEDLSGSDEKEEERARYALGVSRMEFDQYLAPYPLDTYKHWSLLSNYISQGVISKLQPLGTISSSGEFQPASFFSSRTNRAQPNRKAVPPTDEISTGVFSHIPLRIIPSGASVADITEANFDGTDRLATILSYYTDSLDLIGEVQFSFVAFYLGESLDAFEQWKRLVALLCSCERAILSSNNPPSESHAAGKLSAELADRFFQAFTSALYHQLSEAPADFFVDPLSRENFLTKCLRDLFDIALGPGGAPSAGIVSNIKKLKHLMKRKYSWDYDKLTASLDTDDEYAPVVVTEAVTVPMH